MAAPEGDCDCGTTQPPVDHEDSHRYDERLRIESFDRATGLYNSISIGVVKPAEYARDLVGAAREIYAFVRGEPSPGTPPSRIHRDPEG
jgi:hypothetical protein